MQEAIQQTGMANNQESNAQQPSENSIGNTDVNVGQTERWASALT